MVSVVAVKYRKGAGPTFHFVGNPGRTNRAACGARVARLQGEVPEGKVDCGACRLTLWEWTLARAFG